MKIKNLLIISLLVTSSFVNIVLAEEKAAKEKKLAEEAEKKR